MPASTADWVTSQLLQHGRVRRSRLDLMARTRPVGPRLAPHLGLASASMIEVVSPAKTGPAARHGVRRGDWRLSLDGQALDGVDRT